MRLLLSIALLAAIIAGSDPTTSASPDRRQHRAGVRLCKQKYRDAVRGAKYLRGRDRRARIAQARKEREECIALAPK